MTKLFINIFFNFFLLYTSFCIGQTANPTRPSASDNAYLTEYGYTELEIGFSGNDNAYGFPALLKFTFLDELEAGLFISEIIHYENNETNIGDPGLQLKYQFLNTTDISTAIVGKVGFVNTGNTIYTTYLVPTFQAPYAQVDLTVGTSFIKNSDEFESLFFYALALSPKVNTPLGLFFEVFGDISSEQNSVNVDVGMNYALQTDFVLDAGYTIGLSSNPGIWLIQIGLTKTLFKIL